MLNVLYILEPLRYNNIMPELLPEWTRKDIEQLPNFFFRLPIKMLNVLYILEALEHKNIMPGLLPGWTRKDIEQQNIFFFFAYGSKCLTCYISVKRSSIVTLCQDFYLGEIERIKNNCLIFFSATDRNAKRIIYPRSAQE